MSSERARIKNYLAQHELRLAVADGRRVLERQIGADKWRYVKQVRSWAQALAVAVALELCPPLESVPVVSDANFADAEHVIPTAADEQLIKLTEYQMEAIRDDSRIVILCWCRQAGKDFTTSLKAVLDALETGESWYIVSLTKRQALATAKKAQMHAKAISGVLPELTTSEFEVEDENGNALTTTAYGVKLSNGAEIVALPGKDPDALAGLTGNVIFTEMALFPNNGVDHWRVVFPLATRGFKIWAISTPRGPETKFSELRRNAAGKYSVHNVDIYTAVDKGLKLSDESGAPINPDELRTIYADADGWSREYLCCEGDDHAALIDWKWINDCTSDSEIELVQIDGHAGITRDELKDLFDHEVNDFFSTIRTDMVGEPVLGWDIAVTGDLSVLDFGEKLGDVVYERARVEMKKVDDFEYQESVVDLALGTGAVGVGDASGIGREACQRLERKWGETRFKGLVFTSTSKQDLFVQYRDRVQSARVRFGRGDELMRYDVHGLAKESVGVARRLRVVTLRNSLDQASHCDRATANALMIDAAEADGPTEFEAIEDVTMMGGAEYATHPVLAHLQQMQAGGAVLV